MYSACIFLGGGFPVIISFVQGLRATVRCGALQNFGTFESFGMSVKNSWLHMQKFQVNKLEVGPWDLNFNITWIITRDSDSGEPKDREALASPLEDS